MSYLAIGSVTKSIAELLARKLNKPPLMGTGVTLRVTTLPPDDARVDQADGVNLFLYRVAESPFAKNIPWAGERGNQVKSKRPPLALSLNYLLTAYARTGDGTAQDDITAHQILGNALSILHENAILNDIHDSEFDADLNTNFAVELKNSFEKITITPTPVSMEEFSKIWTGLSKSYRLSVAYEVSLVQIGPLNQVQTPGALVQQTALQVTTIGRPQIVSVSPASGAVGTEVFIKGTGFKTTGMLTTVSVAGEQFIEADLVKVTPTEIIVKIPELLQRGPKLPLVVSVAGRDSEPAVFEVTPWLESLSPWRGVTNIPIMIPFDPAGVPLTATVGGQPATVNVDAANKVVRVIVPDTIVTNGPQLVVLTLNPGVPRRTNARSYELIPLIESVTVTTVAAPAQTSIAATGRRLAGADVNVKYGKLLIKKGDNLSATGVTVVVPRVLGTTDSISILVDGRESNLLPPRLLRIEPSEAFPGDQIKIVGAGLSGELVVVSFGATPVPIGAHPFASQLTVPVPAALPAGPVPVTVTVNSVNSNPADLTVLA